MTYPRALALGTVLSLVIAAAALVWLLGSPGAGAQANCTEVLSVPRSTENQITQPFDIKGNSFRLRGEVRNTTNGLFPTLQIFPKSESGLPTPDLSQTTE